MTNQTHYRKAFNSPYLSAADIVEPTVLTIDRVVLEPDKTKKTKESFNTAYFKEKEIRPGEKLKPMVLNVHNSEVLRDYTGTPFIEEWHGPVTVYVEKGIKFGRDLVEGLRLKPGSSYINEDENLSLVALIEETQSDKEAFLKWAGCSTLDQFPKSKYAQAVKMLESKRK